jgi:hypothetical protein
MKPKKCSQCGNLMDYNYHYHCYECNCGKVYNAAGQELQPIENWEDEYNEEDY